MSEPGLARLQRHFGQRVDSDVLASVLAVCDGNVDQAIAFLTAGAGHVVEDPNRANQESIPKDYPAQHPTGRKPRPAPTGTVETEVDKVLSERIQHTKKLFVGEHTVAEHLESAAAHFPEYACTLMLLLNQGVEVARNARPRALATLWHLKHPEVATHVLSKHENMFTLPDVLRALEVLDTPRRIRAVEAKIAKLEATKVKATKLSALKAQLNDLKREFIPDSSVSGALSKKVRAWVTRVSEENLNFFALQLPKEGWKALADIIHLSPADFKLPWFLDFVFGGAPPVDSLVSVCQSLDSANVVDVLSAGHKVPYSYLRTKIRPLPDEAKELIAQYTPIDTIIWYHEELQTPKVDQTIAKRLAEGEEPKFSYGKLMERLLYFQRSNAPFYNTLIPVAEKRLKAIELLLEPPVAVLGDGSYSMDVAIRTATIIASVLTVLSQADLKFFNVVTVDPPLKPKNATDVIKVATQVQADGMTASACALWPYYEQKKKVKFFVVVTDEIENIKFQNRHYFPDLFQKYYEEVFPAKLIFVSFLENPNNKGRMVKALENMGFEMLQFRLDGNRPDLTKLDTLLGLLSSESADFPKQVAFLAAMFAKEGGLELVVDRLLHPPQREEKVEPVPEVKAPLPLPVAAPLPQGNQKNAPDHFCCPITLAPMKDPVIAPSGHSYERETLLAHVARYGTDPLTGEVLQADQVRPNRALRDAIAAWATENDVRL